MILDGRTQRLDEKHILLAANSLASCTSMQSFENRFKLSSAGAETLKLSRQILLSQSGMSTTTEDGNRDSTRCPSQTIWGSFARSLMADGTIVDQADCRNSLGLATFIGFAASREEAGRSEVGPATVARCSGGFWVRMPWSIWKASTPQRRPQAQLEFRETMDRSLKRNCRYWSGLKTIGEERTGTFERSRPLCPTDGPLGFA